MKKLRKDKGITLIALIITIVVLLILALVTINAIKGDGDLIAHAQNAGTKYTAEGENENAVVQNSLAKIEKYLNDDSNENMPFIGKYYGCLKDGCGEMIEIREDGSAWVFEEGETTWVKGEETNTLKIAMNGSEYDFSYEIINDTPGVSENVLLKLTGVSLEFCKVPGIISDIENYYEPTTSGPNIRCEISSTDDAMQYILISKYTGEIEGWKEVGGFYTRYNSTSGLYELYQTDKTGVQYTFDAATKTLVEMEDNTIYEVSQSN